MELHADTSSHPLPSLYVLPGQGEEVAQMIREAVEQDVALDQRASHAAASHLSPPVLAISRSK